MKISHGNLWTYPSTYRVITTNAIINSKGEAVMGAGTALQAKSRYPDIPKQLGHLLSIYGNHVFRLNHNIISFPTKTHWKYNSDINLIKQSAREILKLLKDQNVTVVMPPPGCGLGNLKWEDVRQVIEPILDDRFIVLI